MNAIMGPTGGGKTTLLDALAGRIEHEGISGEILVDRKKPPKRFKFLTGYVVQDDVVMGTLTVRENIQFSANLRLPKSVSQEEKIKNVDEIIHELDLDRCADSKVGTDFARGVSGGERKLTSIGMELIIKPPILFLDEPTTGLDSNTAISVISLLKTLSVNGRTIVFSIHQPRYSIFKLFDRLTLLARGRTVFHGPAADALGHFESLGYKCEEYNSPSDFFLDVIGGESVADQASNMDGALGAIQMTAVDSNNDRSSAAAIADMYLTTSACKSVDTELNDVMSTLNLPGQPTCTETLITFYYVTSFLTQLKLLSQRCVRNIFRRPQAVIMQMCFVLFVSLVVGVIYLHLDFSYPSGPQNRIGAFFFILQYQMYSNMSSVQLFITERVIFTHECANGFYRVSSYFIAKVLCEFIPVRLMPLCVMTIITYFMMGLQVDAGRFFVFFLTLFLTAICGSAICFAVSASVRVYAIANMLVSLVFIVMMIFGGLLINIASLPTWLRWLQYLSVFRYSLNMLLINELSGLTFNGTATDNVVLVVTGERYLVEQGIAYETLWDRWQNIMGLGIMATGIMLLAYIQLRRIRKLK
jgi:ATP-binding cassette subfamily G (WHITE) protein 2